MPKVIPFTGGKRCKDCGEQIEPVRIRFAPKAHRCIECQRDFEHAAAAARSAARPKDIVIIRG